MNGLKFGKEKFGKGSEKSSEKIIDIIANNPSVTISEIAEILNISSRAVEKQIRSLRESGRIKRTGGRKKGIWEMV